MNRSSLTRFAWLSIAAAVTTIGLKATAYFLTGSVGLLSDALESGANLIAAVVALVALTLVSRSPSEEHPYGYDKAEYFSSGVEGGLILVAAFSIIATAIPRLLDPQPIEQAGVGLAVSVVASAVNLGVARVLLRAGKAHNSITLEADSRHLMTDVWTSVGVVGGVIGVVVTGWLWLDPVIALLVALNIILAGGGLLRRSFLGLMDTALPPNERAQIQTIFDQYHQQGVETHALRTRQAGSRRFLTVHVLVPGEWTVQRAHNLVEQLEHDLHQALPQLTLTTHLEPLGDPRAENDTALDQDAPASDVESG